MDDITRELVDAIIGKNLDKIKLLCKNNIMKYGITLYVELGRDKVIMLLHNIEWIWYEHFKDPFLNQNTVRDMAKEFALNHKLFTPNIIIEMIPYIDMCDIIDIFALLTISDASDDVKNIIKIVYYNMIRRGHRKFQYY